MRSFLDIVFAKKTSCPYEASVLGEDHRYFDLFTLHIAYVTYIQEWRKSGDSKAMAGGGNSVDVCVLVSLLLLDLCTFLGSQIVQGPKLDYKEGKNPTAGPGGAGDAQIS